jgi:uncharacterized membrane protein
MTKRMAIALLALIGAFVAVYLTLYKLGYIGQLSCSIGSCEEVNTSRWSLLLGRPVAAWGVGFYVTVFAIAVAGVQPRFADSPGLSALLVAVSGSGVFFSGYLTWLEFAVIHAYCIWCLTSACIVTLIFVVSILDYRSVSALRNATSSPRSVGESPNRRVGSV